MWQQISKRTKYILLLLICAILVVSVVIVALPLQRNMQSYKATVTIDLHTPEGKSNFLPGGTLIHTDTNFSNPTEQRLLGQALGYMNVAIMGWGTNNPEPSPGEYNWSSLDARVQAIRATGTTGIISLCCAPDWMKGGEAGQTNWDDIEVAPLPEHYGDFADLSAQVALRYPDIKYFQVWNEIKGFWSDPTQYIELYNDVYDAVKAVRPDALIGGPYVSLGPKDTRMQRLITTWLAEKHGADFVALDGGPPSTSEAMDYTGAQFYIDTVQWLRQQPDGGADLPVGWAEWYPGTVQNWNDLDHYNATMTNAMIATLKSGAFYALTWGVEGGVSGAYRPGDGQQENLLANGQPTPFYYSLKAFKQYFGPGTHYYKVKQSTQDITVLASMSKTMLVNHLGANGHLTVNGTKVDLAPYQVLVINTPGGRM